MPSVVKKARLEMLLFPDEKQMIEEAAESIGVNVSEFIRLMCIPERRHPVEKVNEAIRKLCAQRAKA